MTERHVAPVAQLLIGPKRLPCLQLGFDHGVCEYQLVSQWQRPQASGRTRRREHLHQHRERVQVVDGERGRALQREVLPRGRRTGAARPPGARSTANDNARTSGLRSAFTFGSELENLTVAG